MEGVAGLFRLLVVPVWLLGTAVLLVGYATQGAALDRGKLVVVQPLMVTTIVWALPMVIVSNVPARTLLTGFDLKLVAWVLISTVVWFSVTVVVFHRGLKRYASASS